MNRLVLHLIVSIFSFVSCQNEKNEVSQRKEPPCSEGNLFKADAISWFKVNKKEMKIKHEDKCLFAYGTWTDLGDGVIDLFILTNIVEFYSVKISILHKAGSRDENGKLKAPYLMKETGKFISVPTGPTNQNKAPMNIAYVDEKGQISGKLYLKKDKTISELIKRPTDGEAQWGEEALITVSPFRDGGLLPRVYPLRFEFSVTFN